MLSYERQKTGQWAFLQIGASLEALLKSRPAQGYLFPYIATLSASDRASEFTRRCRILKMTGISLHSYRYAWAERAYASGYDERFAQAALGHKSRAVHHQYARKAIVVCPALETNVIPFDQCQSEVRVEAAG